MDAPDYDSVEELKHKAGYVPPGALEKLTIARSAELESNHVKWVEEDERHKPGEMTDSDEEEGADCDKEEQQAAEETEEEKELRMQRLKELTAQEIA